MWNYSFEIQDCAGLEQESKHDTGHVSKVYKDFCAFSLPQWESRDAHFHMWSNSPRQSKKQHCRCFEG